MVQNRISKVLQKLVVLPLILGTVSLFPYEEEIHGLNFGNNPRPWLTGPLLAPSAHTVQKGHLKLQPFVETAVETGKYNGDWHVDSRENFYSQRLRIQTKVGLWKGIDFQITPRMMYNETQGRHSVNIADWYTNLNFQILAPENLGGGPAVLLSFAARIPFGKYQHLRPSLLKTDETGDGCWFPGFLVNTSNIWHISGIHYVQLRFSVDFRFGVPVHVKGYNAYGGDASTNGTVIPGNYYDLDAGLEYSLTQRWALACDVRYSHQNRDRFSGKTETRVGDPSAEFLSFAPAIEYSWNRDLGLIAGVWFTAAGRNAPRFAKGMISVNSYF